MEIRSTIVDGIWIFYAEEGAGEPILFVHGWGATHKFWRETIPSLSSRYRCIALDLPGWGASDKPRWDYSPTLHANFLARFLDTLGVPTATVVGHSMGGMTSLVFTLLFPHRVKRLVTVNAPVQGPTALFLKARLLVLPILRWITYSLNKIRWIRRWIAKDFTFATVLDDEMVDDVAKGTYRSMLGGILGIRHTDLTAQLGDIRVPTLLYGSDHDNVIREHQFDLAHRSIPGSQLYMLRDCGHCGMLEKPKEFNTVIGGFLNGASPTLSHPTPLSSHGQTLTCFLLILALVLGWPISCAYAPVPSAYRKKLIDDGVARSVRIQNRLIHYLDKGQGPPVMMLHGLGGSAYDFRFQLDSVAQAGFRVIVPDMLGAGYSDKPPREDYTIFGQAELLADFLDTLNLERCHLLGNSYGGGVALCLALQRPHRVERLILLNAASYRQELPDHVALARLPVIGDLGYSLLPKALVIQRLFESAFYDPRAFTDRDIEEYAHEHRFRGTVNAVRRMTLQADEPRCLHLWTGFPRVKQKTLIVWGENDRILYPVNGRRLHEDIPDSRLEVLAHAGHMPHMELPELVTPMIVDFLKQE